MPIRNSKSQSRSCFHLQEHSKKRKNLTGPGVNKREKNKDDVHLFHSGKLRRNMESKGRTFCWPFESRYTCLA